MQPIKTPRAIAHALMGDKCLIVGSLHSVECNAINDDIEALVQDFFEKGYDQACEEWNVNYKGDE